MARPTISDLTSGQQAWDATINDNNAILRDGPLPVYEVADLTALNLLNAANYDRCLATTVDTGKLYLSDGASWKEVGADLSGSGGGTLSVGLASIADGRLTVSSTLPVPTSDLTAQSTIYYLPYKGHQIALYDGTSWSVYSIGAGISLALAGLTSGGNYDVFLWNDAGTLTLELVQWTNDTTRATALVRQDGVYCKTGELGKRYVGTIRTTSTTTTEDSAAKRFVYSHDNRVPRSGTQADSTASWNPASTAMSAVNGGDADWKHEFVNGLSEDEVEAEASVLASQDSMSIGSPPAAYSLAIDVDAATAGDTNSSAGSHSFATNNSNIRQKVSATYRGRPGVGYHYLQVIESKSATAATQTVYGNSTVTKFLTRSWR